MTHMTHLAGVKTRLCNIKQLGVLLLPPGWDTSPSQGDLVDNYTIKWLEVFATPPWMGC